MVDLVLELVVFGLQLNGSRGHALLQHFQGLFAFADIGHRSDHAYRPSLIVIGDKTPIENFRKRTAGTPEAILTGPELLLLVHHRSHSRRDPCEIVRMNPLKLPTAFGAELCGRVLEQSCDT